MKVVTKDYHSERLKKHGLNDQRVAEAASRRAARENGWVYHAVLGLDHTEDYVQPPRVVECALVVSNPLGLVVVLLSHCDGRVDDRDDRSRRITEFCLPEAVEIFEPDASRSRYEKAEALIQRLHAEHWTPLETLGAMAE